MSLSRCLLVISVAWTLGACGGGPEACDKAKRYQEAKEGGRLVVPEDLDELQPSRELAIPETPETSRSAREAGCLERPPGTYTTGEG